LRRDDPSTSTTTLTPQHAFPCRTCPRAARPRPSRQKKRERKKRKRKGSIKPAGEGQPCAGRSASYLLFFLSTNPLTIEGNRPGRKGSRKKRGRERKGKKAVHCGHSGEARDGARPLHSSSVLPTFFSYCACRLPLVALENGGEKGKEGSGVVI